MKMNTKMLVTGGVMIGLAQILSYVKVFEAPYGGSVTAGSMIPVILFAAIYGLRPGLFAGLVYGTLQFILGPKYSYHIVSILCDYVLAFGLLGLAGLFRMSLFGIYAGAALAVFGRFAMHVISGAVVFASYAPEGMNPWAYSSLYNGAYLLPELVITSAIIAMIYRPLSRFIDGVNQ